LEVHDEEKGKTHPVIVEHPATNFGKNVASSSFESGLDIGATLCTRLDEEQAFILRPLFPFLCWYLPPLAR